MSEWTWSYHAYEPGQEKLREALCTKANFASFPKPLFDSSFTPCMLLLFEEHQALVRQATVDISRNLEQTAASRVPEEPGLSSPATVPKVLDDASTGHVR